MPDQDSLQDKQDSLQSKQAGCLVILIYFCILAAFLRLGYLYFLLP